MFKNDNAEHRGVVLANDNCQVQVNLAKFGKPLLTNANCVITLNQQCIELTFIGE